MRVAGFPIYALLIALTQVPPAVSEDNSSEDVWKECRPNNTCSIEYDYLSDQKGDPFRFQGRVVDKEHPRWREYRRAIRRYPDVQSCLAAGEQNKTSPNLLAFDWRKHGFS